MYCDKTEGNLHIIQCKIMEPTRKWIFRKITEISPEIAKEKQTNILKMNFKLKNIEPRNNTTLWLLTQYMYNAWKFRTKKTKPTEMTKRMIEKLKDNIEKLKTTKDYEKNTD